MDSKWTSDGVGLGGQYLNTRYSDLYAGVHEYSTFTECHIWTPGCGFAPRKTTHDTIKEAKQYAEEQLALLA